MANLLTHRKQTQRIALSRLTLAYFVGLPSQRVCLCACARVREGIGIEHAWAGCTSMFNDQFFLFKPIVVDIECIISFS